MFLTRSFVALRSILSLFQKRELLTPKPNTDFEKTAFGRSLHVDFYDVALDMDDLNFFAELLIGLVKHLGMTTQAPPFIFSSPENKFPDKAGLSGWVPLIESGIQIHTLRHTQFVTLDVYTCGELDVAATLKFLKERLKSETFDYEYLIRGKHYRSK